MPMNETTQANVTAQTDFGWSKKLRLLSMRSTLEVGFAAVASA